MQHREAAEGAPMVLLLGDTRRIEILNVNLFNTPESIMQYAHTLFSL